MRWKKLVCGALVWAALLAPASATIAVTAAPRSSPGPVRVSDWLGKFWSQWVHLAASEAPPDAAVDEVDSVGDRITPTTSEPDGEAVPSAEGGPEWDPDGNS